MQYSSSYFPCGRTMLVKYEVEIETVQADLIAAVRAKVPIGGIAQA